MDLFDLPNTDYRTQIFYTSGVWRKPPGISMVFMTCLGAGGAGGGGFTRALGGAGAGGAGGGSAAFSNTFVPAIFVPDEIFITIGSGGIGGIVSSSGTSGGATYVEAFKDGGANFVYAYANGGGGGGGAISGGSGNGIAGIAGATSGQALRKMSICGFSTNPAGQAGSNGGGAAGSTPTVQPASLVYGGGTGTPTCGGTGGGGCTSSNTGGAGGTITGIATFIPTIPGGASTGADGNVGIFRINFGSFVSMGGTGGGGNGTGSGGSGAIGTLGSGGGGGGTGTSPATAGSGANGGSGLVIIVCY